MTLIDGIFTASASSTSRARARIARSSTRLKSAGQRVLRQLLAAEIDVLVGGHRVDQREILVDGLDPGIHRVLRPPQLHRPAVDEDLAVVRRRARPRGSSGASTCRRRCRRRARAPHAAERERRIGERHHRAEAAADVPGLENCCPAAFPPVVALRSFRIWNSRPVCRTMRQARCLVNSLCIPSIESREYIEPRLSQSPFATGWRRSASPAPARSAFPEMPCEGYAVRGRRETE